MQACHWNAHNTFNTNFYLKDLTWSDNDKNMYLGAIVTAQQSPYPSCQTSHPRKVKRRTYPLQPSLLESNTQGLQVYIYPLRTSEGVWAKFPTRRRKSRDISLSGSLQY